MVLRQGSEIFLEQQQRLSYIVLINEIAPKAGIAANKFKKIIQ
jgi:hypothetical protein